VKEIQELYDECLQLFPELSPMDIQLRVSLFCNPSVIWKKNDEKRNVFFKSVVCLIPFLALAVMYSGLSLHVILTPLSESSIFSVLIMVLFFPFFQVVAYNALFTLKKHPYYILMFPRLWITEVISSPRFVMCHELAHILLREYGDDLQSERKASFIAEKRLHKKITK
jgi:hypothetical protein